MSGHKLLPTEPSPRCMVEALAAEDVDEALADTLASWRREGSMLARDYRCADFRSAWLIAGQVALAAEQAWHHPLLEVEWGRLGVRLWSHDAGGITPRDLELARWLEATVTWRPAAGGALAGAAEPLVRPDDD